MTTNQAAYQNLTVPSATGTGLLEGRLYLPQSTDQDLVCVQIVHGMAEHMARYHAFCLFLARHGLAVCIHDQAGHGRSIQPPNPPGHFGDQAGSGAVLEDVTAVYQAAQILALESSGQLLAHRILLGHSMGSFITRLLVTQPTTAVDGVIWSGTSGSNPAVGPGLMLARFLVWLRGPEHISPLLDRLLSQGNLKRLPEATTPFDWLSRDPAVVTAYCQDPWCGFPLTTAGTRDLLTWLWQVSRKNWADLVPQKLPVLLVSGDADPIGQYGKGPRQVAENLKKTGKQVTLKLYPGGRHESLNESNREAVWQDVLDWLIDHVKKGVG